MRNNYGCDLDSLGAGARIGMMRSAKGDLRYFINGVDQGIACSGLPTGKGEPHPPGRGRGAGGGEGTLHLCRLTTPPSPGLTEVFAVVDLYGQCVQVSITGATGPVDNSLSTSNATEKSFPLHSPGNEHGGVSGLCSTPDLGIVQLGEALRPPE